MSAVTDLLHDYELLADFADEELEQLYTLVQRTVFEPGAIIIQEDCVSTHLFFLETGVVEICKQKDGGGNYVLGECSGHICLGEIAFLEQCRRTASVIAKTEVNAFTLTREDLEPLLKKNPILYYKLVARIGEDVVRKIEHADSRSLEEAGRRTRFGNFVIMVLILFMLQNVMTAFYGDLSQIMPTIVLSLIAMGVATSICVMMIRTVGQPLSFFGLTLKGAGKSLAEAGAMLLLLVLGFYLLIPEGVDNARTFLFSWMGLAYLPQVILQEFTFRGVFQSSLQEFYDDRSGIKSIPITALTFAGAHVTVSWQLTVVTLIMAMALGKLYVRQRNLFGVVLLHYGLGVMGVGMGLLN